MSDNRELPFGTPFGPEIHVIVGVTEAEWDRRMEVGRRTPGWDGEDAGAEPRMHSHPALGITAHAHSQVADARRAHSHRAVTGWDHTPIFVGGAE